MIIFAGFVFFAPNVLGHSDNYIQANPMVTPAHIVPEVVFITFLRNSYGLFQINLAVLFLCLVQYLSICIAMVRYIKSKISSV